MKAHALKPRGFTLIEIIIGLFLMLISSGVASTLFLSATSAAQVNQCRANMMTVANLDQEHKVMVAAHTYTTAVSVLKSESPTVPACPNGGTYSITISDGTATAQNGQTVPVGHLVISCSAAGHGKFAPDIDTY